MKEMNILCSTDRNFLYPTYVTMCSIVENHPSILIHFYLFTGEDVSLDDKEALKKYIESTGNTITYIDVNPNFYSNYIVCERFPIAAYYRLMAHEFLPETATRVLYLDVDIVVNKNIYDDFYCIDFEDKYLVATSHNPDPSYYNILSSDLVNLESAAKGEFFNSGVLLMNLEKFRETNISLNDYDRAYKSCEEKNIKVFYDQGLLNYMFYDKTIYLSSMDYNFRYSIPIDYKRRLDPKREYKKSIIHYTGMRQPYKPWDIRLTKDEIASFGNVPFSNDYFFINSDLNDLFEIWWKYAEKTPVYDKITYECAIKTKWFRRNLLDFTKKHNVLVESLINLKKQKPKELSKTVIKEVYPKGFHPKAYKIGCALCRPYWWLKKIFRKK